MPKIALLRYFKRRWIHSESKKRLRRWCGTWFLTRTAQSTKCPPETTSPPRESGASWSGKQAGDARQRRHHHSVSKRIAPHVYNPRKSPNSLMQLRARVAGGQEHAGRDRVRGRVFIRYLFVVFWIYPRSMRFILAGATNPDELSFGLRIYPPVAVFCCCGGAVAEARRPRRPRVRGSDGEENKE